MVFIIALLASLVPLLNNGMGLYLDDVFLEQELGLLKDATLRNRLSTAVVLDGRANLTAIVFLFLYVHHRWKL